jgi:hypothetical protein
MNKKYEELQRVFADVENGIVDPTLSAAVTAYALWAITSTNKMDYEEGDFEFLNNSDRAINAYSDLSTMDYYEAGNVVKLTYDDSKNAYVKAYEEYLENDGVDLLRTSANEPEKTTRSLLNDAVGILAFQLGHKTPQFVWNTLYKELNYHCNENVIAKARKSKVSIIQYCENEHLLDTLYSILQKKIFK